MPLLIGKTERNEKVLNLNHFRLGDDQAFALEGGLSRLAAQGVHLQELRLKSLSCTPDGPSVPCILRACYSY